MSYYDDMKAYPGDCEVCRDRLDAHAQVQAAQDERIRAIVRNEMAAIIHESLKKAGMVK